MARQVLPIVGAVVGFYFGGPTGAQWGWAIGGLAAGLMPETGKAPTMGDLPVQTSQEGQPRAIIYGTSTCTGYIIDFGPALKTTEIETGEKGAPKNEVNVVYRNYAIGICEGPIGGVLRVWQNDKLVYDVREGSLMLAESAKWISNKALYGGTEVQLPDVYLQLNVSGIGTTPAYRGTAYMVFGLEDLTDSGGAIPQYRWEVANELEESNGSIVSRGNQGTVVSTDGLSWSNSAAGPGLPVLFAAGQRFIGASAVDGNPQYSDDAGVTWQNATGPTMGGDGGGRDGWSRDNTVIIPCGTTKILRSTDLGMSYVEIAGAPDSNLVATVGDLQWISYYQDNLWLSNDDGLTWVSIGPVGANPVYSRGVAPTETMICGQGTGTPFVPTVIRIIPDPSDPTAPPLRSTETLPTITGEVAIREIAYGNEWVAASYEGILLAKISGTWTITGDLGVPSTGLAWNGARYIAAGMDVTHGVIMTSPDGVTWTTSLDEPVAGGVEQWGDVACRDPGFNGGPAILSDIVSDLHSRAAIAAGNYDVSELVDVVQGLTLAGDFTAGSAIDVLRSCYFFDKAEPGDKIYYPKRGKAVVEVLTFDDLVDVPDLSRREQVSEVPKKLHLYALNPTAGYAPVQQTHERSSPDVMSVVENSVSVPVVMDVDTQAQMVHMMHKVMTADAQGEIKLSIPDSFVRIIPSDCVGLVLRGQVLRLRLDENELQEGVMAGTFRRDRQSAYTSNLTGIPIPEPMLPPSTIAGITVLALIDISPRQDSEDDLNILVAGSGASPGWPGWALQRSTDAGANWTTIATYGTPAVIGSLVADVADASEDDTDTTNTVRIQLLRDDQALESITDAQFLSEGGAFALEKADGTYEVMQALDWTQESSGSYAGTTLHRGRLNSGTSAHVSGARFVTLQTAEHVAMESAMIGQSIKWRAVSLGESPELAATYTRTYIGNSQIEWPVASLTLARDGSDVITATWAPRHRFGTDDAPVASVNFTGYRVTLDDGVLAPVTFDTTTAGFTYDASALGDPLDVTVYALNRYTGAGPGTTDTV